MKHINIAAKQMEGVFKDHQSNPPMPEKLRHMAAALTEISMTMKETAHMAAILAENYKASKDIADSTVNAE
jgi:outer membrane protein assembly factor BamD (BamD/ComL family)